MQKKLPHGNPLIEIVCTRRSKFLTHSLIVYTYTDFKMQEVIVVRCCISKVPILVYIQACEQFLNCSVGLCFKWRVLHHVRYVSSLWTTTYLLLKCSAKKKVPNRAVGNGWGRGALPALAPQILTEDLTLSQPLLLAPPSFQTFLRLCLSHLKCKPLKLGSVIK